MIKVVSVILNNKEKKYLFSCNNFSLKKNMNVIVETEKGIQYGLVIKDPYEISEKDIGFPLKNIFRIATEEDDKQHVQNEKDAIDALLKARKLAEELNLSMRIIEANYTFDKSQLIFHFLAESRIDFRELAKKLAQIYKTRIELRQIGVRDKAKEVGGIGPCGRFLCCSTFLTDFNSVSINMAKNQMLALNPTKINGLCGRLLCCLGYEDDMYSEMKKEMPSIGQIFHKDDIEGKIVSVNLFKKTITVETKDKTLIEVEIN